MTRRANLQLVSGPAARSAPSSFTLVPYGGQYEVVNLLTGNSDFSSTDAGAAFNYASGFLQNLGNRTLSGDHSAIGGSIQLADGTFTLSTPMQVDGSNITVKGTGRSSTYINCAPGASLAYILRAGVTRDLSNCHFADFSVDAVANTNINGDGLVINASSTHVENIQVQQAPRDGYVYGSVSGTTFDNTAIDCYAIQNGRDGYNITGNGSSEWINCRAAGGAGSDPTGSHNIQYYLKGRAGFWIKSDEIKLVNCHGYYMGYCGLFCTYSGGLTVIGGEYETNGQHGICLIASSGRILHSRFAHLTHYGNNVLAANTYQDNGANHPTWYNSWSWNTGGTAAAGAQTATINLFNGTGQITSGSQVAIDSGVNQEVVTITLTSGSGTSGPYTATFTTTLPHSGTVYVSPNTGTVNTSNGTGGMDYFVDGNNNTVLGLVIDKAKCHDSGGGYVWLSKSGLVATFTVYNADVTKAANDTSMSGFYFRVIMGTLNESLGSASAQAPSSGLGYSTSATTLNPYLMETNGDGHSDQGVTTLTTAINALIASYYTSGAPTISVTHTGVCTWQVTFSGITTLPPLMTTSPMVVNSIQVGNPQSIEIAGCDFTDCSNVAINTLNFTEYGTIHDNHFNAPRGSGVYLAGNSQYLRVHHNYSTRAFQEQGSANNNVFEDNIIPGGTSSSIQTLASSLQRNNRGVQQEVVSQSINYAASNVNYYGTIELTANSLTVTLPPIAGTAGVNPVFKGAEITVKNGDSVTGSVIKTGASGDKIDNVDYSSTGNTTWLANASNCVIFYFNGTQWRVKAKY